MITTRRYSPAPAAKQLRVLIVDDSELQRGIIAAILASDPTITVIGQAASGLEALRLAAALHPDVITIDLRMPGLDGIATTRRIMEETPTPVVMIAAGISPEDRRLAAEALAAGILAIVPKPTPGSRGTAAAAEMIATVKRMAEVRVIRRRGANRAMTGPLELPRPRVTSGHRPASPSAGVRASRSVSPAIVAIGSSTGGPQALQTILTRLPGSFPLPVVIVQHIAAGFAESVVDWLRPQCALPFHLAAAGMPLDRPGIYLAPTGTHLAVQGKAVALTDEPPVRGHRPSATILFRSVAVNYGARAIGVLLTGMGDDGAVGLAEMKRFGATTIAQDEASSVVFGMPAAAIALGVVDHILPPPDIAPLLVQLAGTEARRPNRDPSANGLRGTDGA